MPYLSRYYFSFNFSDGRDKLSKHKFITCSNVIRSFKEKVPIHKQSYCFPSNLSLSLTISYLNGEGDENVGYDDGADEDEDAVEEVGQIFMGLPGGPVF